MSLLVDETPEDGQLRQSLESSGNYKILRRIELKTTTREACEALRPPGAFPLIQALMVDCEATGTDATVDKLLSFSALPVWYDRDTSTVVGAGECRTWFNDPLEPISEKITELTGITDEMVSGQALDVPAITAMIRDSAICIAHHAGYDRTLASRYIPECASGHWACSVDEVRWKERGYRRSSLIDLMADNGFFYNAHRSDVDCMALAVLLSEGEHAPLSELLGNARGKTCTLHIGCDYLKDRLPHIHERNFLWDAKRKQWHKTFPADDVMSEISGFLSAAASGVTKAHVNNASIVVKTSKTRYINDGEDRGSVLPKETVSGMFADAGFIGRGGRARDADVGEPAPATASQAQSSQRRSGHLFIPNAGRSTGGAPEGQTSMPLQEPARASPLPMRPRSLFRSEP